MQHYSESRFGRAGVCCRGSFATSRDATEIIPRGIIVDALVAGVVSQHLGMQHSYSRVLADPREVAEVVSQHQGMQQEKAATVPNGAPSSQLWGGFGVQIDASIHASSTTSASIILKYTLSLGILPSGVVKASVVASRKV